MKNTYLFILSIIIFGCISNEYTDETSESSQIQYYDLIQKKPMMIMEQ